MVSVKGLGPMFGPFRYGNHSSVVIEGIIIPGYRFTILASSSGPRQQFSFAHLGGTKDASTLFVFNCIQTL